MKEKRYTTIEWWLLAPRQVCFWILGGTTAFMAWNIALTYFQEQTLPDRIIWQLAAIVAFLVWLGVDGALSKLLPFFADEVTAKGYKKSNSDKKKLVAFMGLIAFSLVAASGTMSIWSGGEIADSMTKDTDLSDITTTTATQSSIYNLSLTSIEKELSQARATESDRKRQAERQGREIVLDAWNDGGDSYRKAYNYSRGWLNSIPDNSRKYRTLVAWRNNLKQAKSDSAKLVANEMQIVADLLNDKRHLLSGQNLRDSTILVLSGIGLNRVNMDVNKFNRRRKAIIFVEVLSAVFVVLLSFLIGYWRRVYGQRIDDENYGVLYLLSELWRKLWGFVSDKADKGIRQVSFVSPGVTTLTSGATSIATPKSLVGQGLQPQTTATATTKTKTIITDLKGLKDNCRAHYKRSFTSAKEETKQENREKYLSEKEDLEALGFEVIPDQNNYKLIIRQLE